ncbi:MAG: branched-chain amino acid ABC transporter permease [Acidimicrobiia bacterium]|nr:branched-chain amino acid ABC transporter permease [Acidimicrobiia bacterium]
MSIDWLSAYLIYALFTVAGTVGLAQLLHLQMGLAGIGNFGIVGFFGLGMYAWGVFQVRIPWPDALGDWGSFFLSLVMAVIVSGLAGLLIGWVIADLEGDGVLVGTLGFATIMYSLALSEKRWTGGAEGMAVPDPLRTFNWGVKPMSLFWLGVMILLVVGITYYVARVHRSPYGRLLIAVGQNEPLARSLGKPTFRTKLILFALGSAGMGLVGAVFGVMNHFIRPTEIGIEVTLAAMVGLVMGGSARVWGAIVGVLLTAGLFDIVVQIYLPLPDSWYQITLPVVREIVFGAMLILVLLWRPLGVLGDMRRDKLVERLGSG